MSLVADLRVGSDGEERSVRRRRRARAAELYAAEAGPTPVPGLPARGFAEELRVVDGFRSRAGLVADGDLAPDDLDLIDGVDEIDVLDEIDAEDDADNDDIDGPIGAVSIGAVMLLAGLPDEADPAWKDEALCAETDPEAFFPEKGGSTREAKRVCASCDVRAECLDFALTNDERFGIWGGLSERERRRLKKQVG